MNKGAHHIINDLNDTLFIGTGNRFRRDDSVGIYIGEKLKKNHTLKVLIAENGLENHIGKINKINPGKIIIFDSANFLKNPGYYELLHISEILNDTINTHTISLRQLAGFLLTEEVYVLGIQPGDISFGSTMTEQVVDSANGIIEDILQPSKQKTKIPNYETKL